MFKIFVILFALSSVSAMAEDNPELATLYEEDQAKRGGPAPQAKDDMARSMKLFDLMKDDMARRLKIFDLLLDGKIVTGEDYIRALVILHHTSLLKYTDDQTLSMSSENHLLAFKMALEAHEKGHRLGVHFLAWTYNYYARGVQCDIDKYGFDVVDNRIVPRDPNVTPEQRFNKCQWFDPVPTYQSLGLMDSRILSQQTGPKSPGTERTP